MAISLPRINPAPLESGGDSLKGAADKINSAMLAIEQQALPTPGSLVGQGGKALVVSPDESGLVFAANGGIQVLKTHEITLAAGETAVPLASVMIGDEFNMVVFRGGLIQTPDNDYTFNTSTKVLTFADAFASESAVTILWNYYFGVTIPWGAIEGAPSSFDPPLTLIHTTEEKATSSATYETLYEGAIIARRAWHSDKLVLLVQRSGAGQVRATLSDGTHTAQVEGAAFSAPGVDSISVDASGLDDASRWTISIAAKASSSGTVSLSRVKATAAPVDALSPPLVASGTGGNTNGTTWTELASCAILPAALQPDGRSGLILSGAVTLTGATGAEIRVTVSGTVGGTTTSTSAMATVAASGVVRFDCAYPAVAAPTMAVKIEGRITAGSGSVALPTWQINLEQ